MIIYLDVVLIENILMNILIIYFATYLSKKKSTMYRICISSIIGAVYYVILLLPENKFLNFYLYKVILSMIMVLVGFNNRDIHEFISNIMFFYISSFVFGGAVYGINSLIIDNTNMEYYSLKIIILGVIVGIVVIKKVTYYIHLNSKYSKLIYEIDIYIEENVKRIKAFLDTGNTLKDPISNKSIIIVNLDSISEMLPQDIINVCRDNIEKISEIKSNRLHIIPYISIGNQNGLMVGYRVDKVVINIRGKEKIKIDSVIIALNTTILNNIKNADGLISIDILEKGGVFDEYRKIKVG